MHLGKVKKLYLCDNFTVFMCLSRCWLTFCHSWGFDEIQQTLDQNDHSRNADSIKNLEWFLIFSPAVYIWQSSFFIYIYHYTYPQPFHCFYKTLQELNVDRNPSLNIQYCFRQETVLMHSCKNSLSPKRPDSQLRPFGISGKRDH